MGASASQTGLSSPTEPSSTVSALTGFDPSRIRAPVGSPPTLEWIGLERLAIDESYQRATDSSKSRRLIFSIAQGWDWSLCQPLVISRRADASLFVIDGQHRLSGALLRSDIPHLPCVVLAGTGESDEAKTFIALNTKRQRLSQADIFNALLAAGDEDAKQTATILAETGWRQTRNHNMNVAGRLGCAPMIAKAVKLEGACVVRNALSALREAYPDRPVPNVATLLKALFLIFRRKEAAADPDLFIKAIAVSEPTDWELHAADERRKNPASSRLESYVAAILSTYQIMRQDERDAA